MRIRLTALLLCCAAVLSAQQPASNEPQQAPPVTFRVEINYVEVDASVTDQQGNLVSTLTQDDFEVLEDGKPQKISTFALVNIPVTRPDQPLFATEPVERDVQTNDRVDGRLYLIVLDSLHTDPLNALRVKAAARTFIERRFGANDLAAVVHTSGRSDLGQDFTNNRRLLMASIDRFVGEKLRSATLERTDAYNRGAPVFPGGASGRSGIMDPDEMERGHHARQMLSQLRKLSDFMAGIHGRRKALVLISEGLAYDLADPWSAVDASLIADEVRDAIGAATRGNVSIYAIDPRGLTTGTTDAIEVSGFPDGRSSDGTDSGIRPGDIGLQSMMSETRLSQDSLRMLAEETGGFASVNRNDFRDVFERLVRDNSTYYVLGYYPTNEKRDGKYRKITLRLKKPGLQVRARRGYAAPRGKAPEVKPADAAASPLRAAMNSPLPMAGIPMSVFAAPFKGTAPNAVVAVSVEMHAGDFKYTEKNGTFNDVLEVVFTPIDASGAIKPGKRSKATLAFKADTLEKTKTHGIRVLSALDLPPGRYQIRVAAGEEGAARAGAVLYDLEVPDFSKAPLTMSGVVITSAASAQVPTVGSEGVIAALLAGPTTTAREFAREDTLAVFAEVYENAPNAAAHKLDLSLTARADGGKTVFQAREERSSTELQGGRGGYGYVVQVPLKDFAPGTYVLHVEAKSRAATEVGVGRDIQIRVK